MARRPAAAQTINTPLPQARKASQRKRLFDGMVIAANRDGYVGANVSEVIAEAGVSRPTFYDYFRDREDCFAATLQHVHEQLLADVRHAVAQEPPERALAAAVEAQIAFAASQPAEARFLMKESLAGGAGALHVRDRGARELAQVVEKAFKEVPARSEIPDVPVLAVVGAVQRLLASRLRRGERVLEPLGYPLVAWLASYAAPARQHHWRTLRRLPAPERSPYLPHATLRPPALLPPGRPRIPEEEILENQRQRIIFATAQVVQERGYTAATVSEINRRASVDGRVFYTLFADKQEAFSAVHELGFQFLMGATAGAFFAGESWPERIWEAFRAATQSIDDTPTFAHLAFVEAYAVGPRAIQRVEDSRIAFTIFLQEGYRFQTAGPAPSRIALEAIITTIFEIIYLQARASNTPKTAGQLAHIVHIALAPFMGARDAGRFLDRKLARTGGSGRRTPTSKTASTRGRGAGRQK